MRHIKLSSLWVRLVVILPLFLEGITCLPGYSIQVNSSVSVQEGLCVSIPCNFTADYRNTFTNSFGYWFWSYFKPSTIAATNDKPSSGKKTNFHLMGNPDTGDCTLTIADARKEDEGEYYFRFEDSKDSKVKYNYNKDATTSITVIDLTEEPVILDLGTVIAGINKTVTCAPPGNCSVTSLSFQWKKSNVPGIWGNSSSVTFTPTVDDDQETITCEMKNAKGKITRKTILLDVSYPPGNIEIIIHSSEGREVPASPEVMINQTETLTLVCRADGKPNVTVVWVRGKDGRKTSHMSNNGSLAMINVTSEMAGAYRCMARNDLGSKEQRIEVVRKQEPTDEQETCVNSTVISSAVSYRDIVIGFICGIIITTFIILLHRLIMRNKMKKKKIYALANEQSTSSEAPGNEIYMNISKPEPKAELHEEATDNNEQLDPGDVTSNEDDLHYSTVTFSSQSLNVPSCQTETEYAEIHVK